jgi:hypothetical protein
VQKCGILIYSVWDVIAVKPLQILYFQGPNIRGYGFWGGISEVDACAQLTGVSALVWSVQTKACAELLERNFVSFSTAVFIGAYVCALYSLARTALFHYFYVRPLMQELKRLNYQHRKSLDDFSSSPPPLLVPI